MLQLTTVVIAALLEPATPCLPCDFSGATTSLQLPPTLSSLPMSPIQETQWRVLRRKPPWQQARILAAVLAATFLYGYCLLCLQPQQSQHNIIPYQIQEASRYHREQYLYSLEIQQRREQLVQKRQEARLKRIKTAQDRMANRTAAAAHNATNTVSTGTENKIRISRFWGVVLSLATSICMISTARFVVQVIASPPEQRDDPRARRRTRRSEREVRFREWAQALNRQREAQGERPLSLASLRLVVRGRDFSSGDDYEGLLQIEEEAGPAMHALLQSMGATREEIERCPHRMLVEGDDLLVHVPGKDPPHCPVCLERYEVQDQVRTIPCFHTFHTDCIDPWLSQKAVCPVCKHPAVG